MTIKNYNPFRIYRVFRVLLTLFLLFKKQKSIFFIRVLTPIDLINSISNLGASFIKLAQILATRSDFFEEKYIDKLKLVHDNLAPMSKADFEKVYKSASFLEFDKTPIASASIGQVHKAMLFDGITVAVKLRRYGIKDQIKADLKIISFFTKLFKPLFSHYTKHSIEALVIEFSNTILQEVNMQTELENLKKFSSIYKEQNIKFPKPYEKFCNEDMLVMSFEEGFRFDDAKNIKKYNIDINKVISDLVLFYVEQMLINGFFHADPHPGNVLIDKNSQIILLDYGMVKFVPNETRLAIIELLRAASNQDYIGYIGASKKLGITAYETPTSALAEFVEKIFSIFSQDSLDKGSMNQLAFELMSSTQKFPFKLPQEAIYILRVSVIIEGLGTTYIENFNGVKDILPILMQNIPRAFGAKETIIETLVDEAKQIPQSVLAIKNTFHKISNSELEVELSKLQLSYFKKSINETLDSILFSLVLILTSFFVLLYDKSYSLFSSILFVVGIARLIYRR